jgi:hypothetical protein
LIGGKSGKGVEGEFIWVFIWVFESIYLALKVESVAWVD